jgi:hypothetical protein
MVVSLFVLWKVPGKLHVAFSACCRWTPFAGALIDLVPPRFLGF